MGLAKLGGKPVDHRRRWARGTQQFENDVLGDFGTGLSSDRSLDYLCSLSLVLQRERTMQSKLDKQTRTVQHRLKMCGAEGHIGRLSARSMLSHVSCMHGSDTFEHVRPVISCLGSGGGCSLF